MHVGPKIFSPNSKMFNQYAISGNSANVYLKPHEEHPLRAILITVDVNAIQIETPQLLQRLLSIIGEILTFELYTKLRNFGTSNIQLFKQFQFLHGFYSTDQESFLSKGEIPIKRRDLVEWVTLEHQAFLWPL